MKSLIEYVVNENASNESNIGKMLDNVFQKNQNKLTRIIQSRQAHWDDNNNSWSREPMFLIAGPKNELIVGSNRDYSWLRWKYIKGKRDEIQGTFKNYNVKNDEGNVPNAVIGIYYDRHFELITSLEVFNKLYDIIDKNYEKYYNNLYESNELNEADFEEINID